ncbi:calcium-binding protein [uncultured Paracoccus sp.]|uniref:calcium-binding protein n=1 Tax=uncultured Paracoccus sp. TaxID=189685 RepID=UPI0026164F68|nr:calcium-binding protein [uncultured Paracoccus sp.]
MTGQIFIEASDVEIFGLPSGATHLYLVFRDSNGDEYVIRSGPERKYLPWFGDMKVEANVRLEDSADDRDGDPPAERASTPLDFPDLTDDQAWALMVKYARMIDQADQGYEVFGENSNAFIGAMLAAAGGDPLTMLPTGVSRDETLGVTNYDDIMEDVRPPADGILRGTSGNDAITGIQVDDVIRSFSGNDTVSGGRGNDRIHAGRGDDVVYGDVGNDTLLGGDGDGADRLYGGSGNDVLRGGAGSDVLNGGSGRNTLVGGAGADMFQFVQDSVSRITDFEDGVDSLRFHGAAGTDYAELSVSRFGALGQHTRIDYDDAVVELLNIDRALVDPSDFDLLLA